MKKILIPVCAALFFLLPSCKKYIDLTPKGALLVETAKDFYDLVSFPNRAYVTLNFQYLSDNAWMKESNFIGINKNLDIVHFTGDTIENRVNLISSSNFYSRCYVYINRWNTVISLVDDSKGDASLKALAKAEARILRAFDHFLLVNVYAKAYDPATAATDGGICLMDKYDLEASPRKSTVKDAYDFIQRDIDEALPLLQETTGDPYHPSLAFGWALKAKVHLFKREWTAAREAALKALTYKNQLFDLVDYSKKGGPTALAVPAAENPEVLSYMYQTGYNEMNFMYTSLISPELRNLFGTNDARFNLFFNTTNATWIDIGSGAAYWATVFTRFFYPTVGLKTGEVYLMAAEAYAREGNLASAMNYVNQLRLKRITGGTVELPVPGTQQETVQLIIDERRKELLFGVNRFFDLKRLNLEPAYAKTITRTFPLVNTTVPKQTYTIQPNSRLYIIPFPQDVLKMNQSLRLNTDEVIPF